MKLFIRTLVIIALTTNLYCFAFSPKVYGDINLGYGRIDFDSGIDNEGSTERNNKTIAANFGLHLNEKMAVEFGYVELPELVVHHYDDVMSLESHAITAGFRTVLPIKNKLSFIARAGIARVSNSLEFNEDGTSVTVDNNDTSYTSYIGLGFHIDVKENAFLTLQAFSTQANENELPATYNGMIGFGYKFN